jgi:23S rRNA (pseudouridine1915-N3)-methyltransferase
MHLHLLTIGKDRKDDYGALIARYQKRLPWKLTLHEKLPRKPNAPTPQRMEEEATLLLDIAKDCDVIVALDEHGKSLTSLQFAETLSQWQQEGRTTIAFCIGGADGLHPTVLQRADLKLAFGAQTWPHQMVRLMLVEQLYRAYTILTGHPYHRE